MIDAIKSRLTITEAAERYAQRTLTRRGNTYWCSCLNNSDSFPSMQLDTTTDKYRCFSCHSFGDQIDLVAEAMNTDLAETIKFLAEQYGISTDLTAEDRARIDRERKAREEARRVCEQQEQMIADEYQRLCKIEREYWHTIKQLHKESILSEDAENALVMQSKITYIIDTYLGLDTLEDKVEWYERFKDWR